MFVSRHVLLKEPLWNLEGFASTGMFSIWYGLGGKSRYGPWPGLASKGVMKIVVRGIGNGQSVCPVGVENLCSSEC